MAVTVSWVGYTRINDSNTNTNWGNWGSAGGSPSAESPIAYQGGLAVNKKINSSSLGGIDYDPGAGAVDMSAATGTHFLWFAKAIASDSFDLNATYGMKLALGSANNAYYEYNVAGSGANNSRYSQYPVQGGYLITAIDPNISFWREATQGTPALTAVDWFGLQCAFIVGAAKAENIALDAIDVGSGLRVVTTASSIADFLDFVAWDQDTTTNRYGVVTGSGNVIRSNGMLFIGNTSTECDFEDSTSIVLFPDGYHSTGLVGVTVDLSSANSVVDLGCQLIGEGSYNTSASTDTRPDFITTGTAGSMTISGQFLNHRNITLTSAVACDGAIFECELLTQSSADIENCTVITNSASQVACLQDPTFGATTDLNNTAFVQGGLGHAIEIDTAGDYTLTNLSFSGYGANTTNDAAVFVSASSGTVNLYVTNPTTYRSAGATVNVIENPVTVKVTAVETDGTKIQNARVHLEATATTGTLPVDVTVTIVNAGTTATVTHTAHGLASNDKVVIRGASHNQNNGTHQITVTGTNTYTYTMASAPGSSPTGTIKSTFVVLNGLTDVNGEISMTRVFPADQSVVGRARKSSSAPYYKNSPLTGTVSSSQNTSLTAVMISDD